MIVSFQTEHFYSAVYLDLGFREMAVRKITLDRDSAGSTLGMALYPDLIAENAD
jgi:hypothetical protein